MPGFLVVALVVDSASGLCKAGIADVPRRAVFHSVVFRPEMLGIMACLDQKNNYVLGWFCWVTIPLVLCSLFVFTPKMLGILVGMDQKDSGALIVDPGSGICKACFAGFTPRSVFLGCRQARGQVGLDQKNNYVLGSCWC